MESIVAFSDKTVNYILTCVVVLLVLDYVWIKHLSLMMNQDYEKTVVSIQNRGFSGRIAGLLAYPLMAYSIMHFTDSNYNEAAKLGLVFYGIFNLTNLYMFKNWDYYTCLADTTWGTILFATTALFMDKVGKNIVIF